jgi:hypothetical protein
VSKSAKPDVQAVTKNDFVSLASFLEGREGGQRVHKKSPHGEALRSAGQLYENREYVAAYESYKPVFDKVTNDMQRILARNVEFEANKLARQQQKPLAVAKENVQQMRAHAQQVIDQLDRLLHDLQRRPLVRFHLKKGGSSIAASPKPSEETPPTVLHSADETRLQTHASQPLEAAGGARYRKAPFAPPQKGFLYSVRDKAQGERIIQVIGTSADDLLIDVVVLKDGKPSKQTIQLTVDSLARQAAKGWCSLLLPLDENAQESAASGESETSSTAANATLRLDIQNFSRCCADIARANIKFTIQLIKDVADGPFRAGDYEQAFLTFEQHAVGFAAAVASSRRAIADGRRELTAEKGNLSGKEIQERSAAFTRGEQLINTAERSFATILEGLRMYLRAQQG